mgnify:CR=1 FL=1
MENIGIVLLDMPEKCISDEFYAEDVVQDVFTGLFQQTNYFVSEMAALKCIYYCYL